VLTGVALVVCLLLFGLVPFYLGQVATSRRFPYKDKENAGVTPATLGLQFEEISFRSSDGVDLGGWWVPAPDAKGSVILVHGLNRSRIEMVRKVPFLNSRGWNTLALDLRRHGTSGGDRSTFGATEKLDVAAALDFARTRPGDATVVWGVSMGAAAAMLAAEADQEIDAVVCDSSFRSVRDTTHHHFRLFRSFAWWLRLVPEWPAADLTIAWMGRLGRFDPDDVDIVRAARALRGRPALFVAVSEDRRMPSAIASELAKEVGPAARVLVVPGKSHGGAWRDGTAAYESAVGMLLEEAVARRAGRPVRLRRSE